MKLCDFALAAWARPGVAETCLELQDRHGQCVPLLIWRAWAQLEARAPDAEAIRQALGLARALDGAVIAPQRGVRRALKSAVDGLDEDARESLRAAARALELAAERALLDGLEKLTPARTGRSDEPLAETLRTAILAWEPAAADPAGTLAGRLAEQLRGPWPC